MKNLEKINEKINILEGIIRDFETIQNQNEFDEELTDVQCDIDLDIESIKVDINELKNKMIEYKKDFESRGI